ncbi:MAG: hypothetical protein ACW987_02785 [Candidatus Thorarchaeota archaeon]
MYMCPECGNVGYDRVVDKKTDSQCSLCDSVISNGPEMVYVGTAEDARRRAGMLAIRAQAEVPKTSMGLGLRRRILSMVQGLVELNRGRPVTLERVIAECADAGIPRERAMHFLNILRDEDLITHDHESVKTVL